MSLLIDGFMDSLAQQSAVVPEDTWTLLSQIMFDTGGNRYVRPEMSLPEIIEFISETGGTVGLRSWTEEQVQSWLTFLVNSRHMDEAFLIASLIAQLDRHLEATAENAGKSRQVFLKFVNDLKNQAADPVQRPGLLEQVQRTNIGSGTTIQVTDENLDEVIDRMTESLPGPTLEEMRAKQEHRHSWRHVTAGLVDGINTSSS